MSVTPSSAVVGIFSDQSEAERAIEALSQAGFEREQMQCFVPETPGFFSGLKSLFTGDSDLTSQLTDMGLSGTAVQYYSEMYEQGNIILAVNTLGDNDRVLAILRQYGAYPSDSQPGSSTETMGNGQQSMNDTPSDRYVQSANSVQPDQPASYQAPTSTDASSIPFSPDVPNDSSMPFPQEASADPNMPFSPDVPNDPDMPFPQETSADPNMPFSPDVPNDSNAPFPQNNAESPSQAGTSDPEEVEVDEVVMPAYQTEVDASEQEGDEVETSADQIDISEQEVSENGEAKTPADQTDTETFVPEIGEVDEIEEVEMPDDQYGADTPEQEGDETDEANEVVSDDQEMEDVSEVNEVEIPDQETDEVDEAVTPTDQTSVSTSDQQPDSVDETNYMEETPADQVRAGSAAIWTAEQPPQSHGTLAEYSNQLQQLHDQVQSTQQQLQDAKAELEAAKQLDAKYQVAKQQLQELQAELQATQAQLQETKQRIASYQ